MTHLIRARLSTTPVEQHLLDGVCIRYTEAGWALHLVYFGHSLISSAKEKSQFCFNIYMLSPAPLLFLVTQCFFVYPYPPPSFSRRSTMALRACMAEVLGSVWALISSLRLSACRRSTADNPLLRDDASSSRSNTLSQGQVDQICLWKLKHKKLWVIILQELHDPPAHFFACVRGWGRGVAVWFWLDCSS